MAKLSIVMNKFIRDVYTSPEKPVATYEKYLRMLEEWSSSLPPELRYLPDRFAGGTSSTPLKADELPTVSLVPRLISIPVLTMDSFTSKCSIFRL